ncbi:MAG: amino acid ABC transporter ATP-binding protein [Rickettsiaceae bacterium]|nr:amino acid ABC transporter ATP-binding protein [Rickettsiaceae bacterium]
MIRLEDVSKKYGSEYAIKNVSFELKKGESLAIVGPSGGGKSTLLKMINRLEAPTKGHVFIDNEKLTEKNRRKACLKIGMVFQQYNLFPHMNVLENLIYTPCAVLKMNKEEAVERAIRLLQNLNLKGKIDFMPKELSGGQKQRIAIARSLMMKPEVMLFDEPTSALDPEVIKDIVNLINELRKDISIITVTHHLKFAHAISERVIFMDQGQILCDQKTEAFFKNPKSHRAKLFLDNVGDFM